MYVVLYDLDQKEIKYKEKWFENKTDATNFYEIQLETVLKNKKGYVSLNHVFCDFRIFRSTLILSAELI